MSRAEENLLVVGQMDIHRISRAGRILTRLKAMVPLTVRDAVACPLRALPARSFLLEEKRRSQGLAQDPDRRAILRISSDNWSLSIRMRMQISKADQDRRFLKIPSFRYCGFHKSTVSFCGAKWADELPVGSYNGRSWKAGLKTSGFMRGEMRVLYLQHFGKILNLSI